MVFVDPREFESLMTKHLGWTSGDYIHLLELLDNSDLQFWETCYLSTVVKTLNMGGYSRKTMRKLKMAAE